MSSTALESLKVMDSLLGGSGSAASGPCAGQQQSGDVTRGTNATTEHRKPERRQQFWNWISSRGSGGGGGGNVGTSVAPPSGLSWTHPQSKDPGSTNCSVRPVSSDARSTVGGGHSAEVPRESGVLGGEQVNLIELTSSNEEFSVDSTSSEYKSCCCDDDHHHLRKAGDRKHHQDEVIHGGGGNSSNGLSNIQIILDPAKPQDEDQEEEVDEDDDQRLQSYNDYLLTFGIGSCPSPSSRRCFLSPPPRQNGAVAPNDDEVDYLPEEEPFVSRRTFPQCPSAAQLSVTSSNSDPTVPTCRICHLPAADEDNLISPCRCSGTMQYIHNSCLMKWLDLSSRKSKRPPSCELCLYQYHRHKKFKVSHWQLPHCSLRDKILHTIFFLSLLTMIGAATVTILCFKHDKGGPRSLDKNKLTESEIVTLVCGVLFFVAFFLAMYVEVKARSTIYKIIMDFLYLNQQWYIDEYDRKADIQSVSA